MPSPKNSPAQAAPPAAADHLLTRPAVDRAIACVAVLPFALTILVVLLMRPIPIENLLLLINMALLTVTTVLRRPPARVTMNPWFWVLAFFATYWPYLLWPLAGRGEPVVPRAWTIALAALGLAITVWARLSLGRNIGFVPAERQIVTTGAYRYMRHPIYTGVFVLITATALANFNWLNLAANLTWAGLWIVKTFVEERFLRQSPAYAQYMTQVRWRWIPFVA